MNWLRKFGENSDMMYDFFIKKLECKFALTDVTVDKRIVTVSMQVIKIVSFD